MKKRLSAMLTVPLSLVFASCTKQPDKVVETFTAAASAGDTATALDQLDPDLKQVGGMKLVAALRQAAARAQTHGGLKKVEVVESRIDGDHGSVSVRQTFNDGTFVTEIDKVRKADGRWLVTL